VQDALFPPFLTLSSSSFFFLTPFLGPALKDSESNNGRYVETMRSFFHLFFFFFANVSIPS